MKFKQVLVERCPTCDASPYLSMKESYGGMDVYKLECPGHFAVEEQGYTETVSKWNYWTGIMREAKAREDCREFWSDFDKEKEMIDDVFEERESRAHDVAVRRSRTDGVFGQHRKYFDPNIVEAERKLHENHFELELEGEMPVEEPSPEMREAVKKFAHEHHKTGCGCDYDPRDTKYSFEPDVDPNDWDWYYEEPDGVGEFLNALLDEEETDEDPWKHRSERMKCETCMWYVPKCNAFDEETDIGRCRRHAPTNNGYPVVFWSDWCGDHRLDEEKI